MIERRASDRKVLILELAMRRCVFEKKQGLFPISAKHSNPSVIVAQPDERLASKTQKNALR